MGYLVRVVDGDTAIVRVIESTNLLLGTQTSWQFRARLARIQAPEKNTPGGAAATEALQAILSGPAYLLVQIVGPDKYHGRYVCELIAGGKNVSDALVQVGHARYQTF